MAVSAPPATSEDDADAHAVVGIAEIARAARLRRDVAVPTPVIPCPAPVPGAIDGPLWLKCESLQRTGSFKLRGAFVRIARLDSERDRKKNELIVKKLHWEGDAEPGSATRAAVAQAIDDLREFVAGG